MSYRIGVDLYEADNTTHVREITTGRIGSREWRGQLRGLGSAKIDVPLEVEDSGAMVANPDVTAMTRGRILRYSLDGTARFAAPIRKRSQTGITGDGENAQYRTFDCLGLLSEWDLAVLPPDPSAVYFSGGDTRDFGWMSREADHSALSAPTILRAVLEAGAQHPDPWLWAFTSYFDASTHQYFTFDYTPDDDVTIAAHNGLIDFGNLWLGSVPVGSGATAPESSKDKNYRYGAKIPGGVTTRFAWDITGLGGAETAFASTVFTVDDPTTGQLNAATFLFHTGIIPPDLGGDGTAVYGFKCSADPVGPTAKQIIRSVLGQVQDEDAALAGWDVEGSDDTLDSNGNAMPGIAHIPFPIGAKLGSEFLLPLAAAWCDLAVSVEGKTLYVYNYGERGNYHTTPGTLPIYSGKGRWAVSGRIPNIRELTHEERSA